MSDNNPIQKAGAVTTAGLAVGGIAIALSGGALALPMLGAACVSGLATLMASNKKK